MRSAIFLSARRQNFSVSLQEKEVRRVGGKETIKLDVRIITATNKKLDRMKYLRGDSAKTFTTGSMSSLLRFPRSGDRIN